MRTLILATLALFAACSGGPEPLVIVPAGGPRGPEPSNIDMIPMSELERQLDARMVDKVFPLTRESTEILLCDRSRVVVDAPPVEVQAAMLSRAYRPGCR